MNKALNNKTTKKVFLFKNSTLLPPKVCIKENDKLRKNKITFLYYSLHFIWDKRRDPCHHRAGIHDEIQNFSHVSNDAILMTHGVYDYH